MDRSALQREVQLLWTALEDEKKTVHIKNEVIAGLQQTLILTEDRVRQLERELRSLRLEGTRPGVGSAAAGAGGRPAGSPKNASPKNLFGEDEGLAFSPPASLPGSSGLPDTSPTGTTDTTSEDSDDEETAQYWRTEYEHLKATTSGTLRYSIESTEEAVRKQMELSFELQLGCLWQQEQASKEAVRSTAVAYSKMKEINENKIHLDDLHAANDELRRSGSFADSTFASFQDLEVDRSSRFQRLLLQDRGTFLDEVSSFMDRAHSTNEHSQVQSNHLERKLKRAFEERQSTIDAVFDHFRRTVASLASTDSVGDFTEQHIGRVQQQSSVWLDLHDVLVVMEYTDSAHRCRQNASETYVTDRVFQSFAVWMEEQFEAVNATVASMSDLWASSSRAVVQQQEGNVFKHILAAKRATQVSNTGAGALGAHSDPNSSSNHLFTSGGPGMDLWRKKEREMKAAISQLEDRLSQKTKLLTVQQSKLDEQDLLLSRLKRDLYKAEETIARGSSNGSLSYRPSSLLQDADTERMRREEAGDQEAEQTETTDGGGEGGLWASKTAKTLKDQLLQQAAALERLEQGAYEEWRDQIYSQFSLMMHGMAYYGMKSWFNTMQEIGITMYDNFVALRQAIAQKEASKQAWNKQQEKLALEMEQQRGDEELESGESFGRLNAEEIIIIHSLGASSENTLADIWYRAKINLRNELSQTFSSLFDNTFHLFLPTNRRLLAGTKTQITEEAMNLLMAQKDQALTASHWLMGECSSASRNLANLMKKMDYAIGNSVVRPEPEANVTSKGTTPIHAPQALVAGQPSGKPSNKVTPLSGSTNTSFLSVTPASTSGEGRPLNPVTTRSGSGILIKENPSLLVPVSTMGEGGAETPTGFSGGAVMGNISSESFAAGNASLPTLSQSLASNTLKVSVQGGSPTSNTKASVGFSSSFTQGAGNEAPQTSRRRDQIEAVASASYFNSVCERLLDGVATIHRRMIETEEYLVETETALKESDACAREARSMMDEASITQLVEREISDDVLVLLRETLKRERNYCKHSISVLITENQDRNEEIRYLQVSLMDSQTSARSANFAAQYIWHAYVEVQRDYYETIKKYLAFCQLSLLPSPSEISNLFIYVHIQLGITLQESIDAMFEQFCNFKAQFARLDDARKFYNSEVVRMSDELFAMAADRRLEKASTEWFEDHLKENLLQGYMAQFTENSSLYYELLNNLSGAVSDRAIAQASAATDSKLRRKAEKNLRALEGEVEETKMAFDIVNEKAVESYKLLEVRNQENKRLLAEVDLLQKQRSQGTAAVDEVSKEKEVLRSLLKAEQSAHELAKAREEQLQRDTLEATAALQTSEAEVARWMALVEKEKEAHRATIRSIAKK